MRSLLILVGFAALALPAAAQEPSKIDLLVDAGWSWPQSNALRQTWSGGASLAGGVAYRLSDRLAVQLVGSFEHFSVNEEAMRLDWERDLLPGFELTADGGAITVLSVTPEVRYSFSADAKDLIPYVAAGVGLSNVTQDKGLFIGSFEGQEIARETLDRIVYRKAAVNVAAGVDVPAGKKRRVYFEARYRMVLVDVEKIEYLGLRAGVRFGL